MYYNDYPLEALNSFGIAARAEYFARATNIESLQALLAFWARRGPLHILGGGSNILLVQEFLPGLCIQNALRGKNLVAQNARELLLDVAAGEDWDQLVAFCVAKGWGGIENLARIPGSVGAAPIQNIGAYGVELADVLDSVLVLVDGRIKRFSAADCQLGYRSSLFKYAPSGKYIVLSLRLRLQKAAQYQCKTSYGALQAALEEQGLPATIGNLRKVVSQIRSSKLPDPKELGNAGSFFKNPFAPAEQALQLKAQYPSLPLYPGRHAGEYKLPAAWLIEQSGWKGKSLGPAAVHKKQALVLVNATGKAKGQDILRLAETVQAAVQAKFALALEMELHRW